SRPGSSRSPAVWFLATGAPPSYARSECILSVALTVTQRGPDRTRYSPPSLPLPLLRRQRLLDRLAGAERHRLTLVQAAAGYGKTTVIAQYADLLRASGRHTAWLTLQRGDEDPLVLFSNLVGALRRDTAEFGGQLTSFLDRGRRLERRLSQLAQALAEELAPLGELIFFLDDHPSVRGAPLASFGNELAEVLPDNTHLVLATRRTPQLAGLPRWRMAGSVLDISAAELAFTRSEAVDLLRGEFALDLPEHAIDAMYSRTGGWPAGSSPDWSRRAWWCATARREAIASSRSSRSSCARARESFSPRPRSSICTAGTPNGPPHAETSTARSITSSRPEIIGARRSWC